MSIRFTKPFRLQNYLFFLFSTVNLVIYSSIFNVTRMDTGTIHAMMPVPPWTFERI